MSNDPKYDRGVKKLFGAYTEEDANGMRILDTEVLKNILRDFEIYPGLCEGDEVSEALQQTVKSDKRNLKFHDFKKLLKTIAVNEFKKAKYNLRFHTYEDRHNQLLAYLQCDNEKAVLERAQACQMARRREHGGSDDAGADDSMSTHDSSVVSRKSRPSSSKRTKKSPPPSSSSQHYSSQDGGGEERGDEDENQETLDQRIQRRQDEAFTQLREKRKQEEEARRREVEQIATGHGGGGGGGGGGVHARPASASRSIGSSGGGGGGGGGGGDGSTGRPRSAGAKDAAGRPPSAGSRPQSGGKGKGSGGGMKELDGWAGGGDEGLADIDEHSAQDGGWKSEGQVSFHDEAEMTGPSIQGDTERGRRGDGSMSEDGEEDDGIPVDDDTSDDDQRHAAPDAPDEGDRGGERASGRDQDEEAVLMVQVCVSLKRSAC